MIESLHISNYALIDSIDINLAPGFNIITGETGAGKSIIMGALSLLGGRADSISVAPTASRSSKLCSVDAADGVAAILKQNDLDADGTGDTLRRELRHPAEIAGFKSMTRPVNLPLLKQVVERLVDIHSQHENQRRCPAGFHQSWNHRQSLPGNGALLCRIGDGLRCLPVRHSKKIHGYPRFLSGARVTTPDFIQYQYGEQLAAMSPSRASIRLSSRNAKCCRMAKSKTALKALSPLANAWRMYCRFLTAAVGAVRELAETFEGWRRRLFLALADRLDSARTEISDVTDTIADVYPRTGADPHRLCRCGSVVFPNSHHFLNFKHHVEDADGLGRFSRSSGTAEEALDDAEKRSQRSGTCRQKGKKTAWELAQQLERRSAAASDFAMRLRERSSLCSVCRIFAAKSPSPRTNSAVRDSTMCSFCSHSTRISRSCRSAIQLPAASCRV